MRLLSLVAALVLAAPFVHAQNASLSPTYGDVNLSEGFRPDPNVTSLTAGGSISSDVSGCSYGTVADAPDVDLRYTTSGRTTLYIYATASEDITLLVNMPNGSWQCDDDSFGNGDPILVIRNAPAGLYDIWVGTYGSDTAAATLYITEIDPRNRSTPTPTPTPNRGGASPNASLSPTYGDVALREGFRPDPHETSLTAGGSIASNVSGCSYGTVAEAPDVDLRYTTSGRTTLYIYAVSSDDTTLLINMPNGSWQCDDDSYGDGDPMVIIRNAPAGLYDIWVGTYGSDTSSATLYISEIDPR